MGARFHHTADHVRARAEVLGVLVALPDGHSLTRRQITREVRHHLGPDALWGVDLDIASAIGWALSEGWIDEKVGRRYRISTRGKAMLLLAALTDAA